MISATMWYHECDGVGRVAVDLGKRHNDIHGGLRHKLLCTVDVQCTSLWQTQSWSKVLEATNRLITISTPGGGKASCGAYFPATAHP